MYQRNGRERGRSASAGRPVPYPSHSPGRSYKELYELRDDRNIHVTDQYPYAANPVQATANPTNMMVSGQGHRTHRPPPLSQSYGSHSGDSTVPSTAPGDMQRQYLSVQDSAFDGAHMSQHHLPPQLSRQAANAYDLSQDPRSFTSDLSWGQSAFLPPQDGGSSSPASVGSIMTGPPSSPYSVYSYLSPDGASHQTLVASTASSADHEVNGVCEAPSNYPSGWYPGTSAHSGNLPATTSTELESSTSLAASGASLQSVSIPSKRDLFSRLQASAPSFPVPVTSQKSPEGTAALQISAQGYPPQTAFEAPPALQPIQCPQPPGSFETLPSYQREDGTYGTAFFMPMNQSSPHARPRLSGSIDPVFSAVPRDALPFAEAHMDDGEEEAVKVKPRLQRQGDEATLSPAKLAEKKNETKRSAAVRACRNVYKDSKPQHSDIAISQRSKELKDRYIPEVDKDRDECKASGAKFKNIEEREGDLLFDLAALSWLQRDACEALTKENTELAARLKALELNGLS